MKFTEIIEQLQPVGHSITPNGNCNPEITSVASVEEAFALGEGKPSAGTLSYIEGDKFASRIETTSASALILPLNEALQARATERGIAWMSTPEPKLLFAKAIALFYRPFHPEPSIHPSAVIAPSVQLGDDVYIGAHVVIQDGVRIGNGVCIHPNVVIYPGVTIGDRTIFHANCTIHERSQIGSDCVIHSGAVIGAEGFGFVPTAQGWHKMEQSGYTVLEDGVEIGCNSAVDRPAVGETRIKKNTKLDNLVHVAHGCTIGENCAFAAQVGLAGGVTVGNRVLLGGQVGVANQATIGEGAIATAQSGIHGDVSQGEIVSGSPAVPNQLYLKVSAIYKRLPEMYQTLRQLSKKR